MDAPRSSHELCIMTLYRYPILCLLQAIWNGTRETRAYTFFSTCDMGREGPRKGQDSNIEKAFK